MLHTQLCVHEGLKPLPWHESPSLLPTPAPGWKPGPRSSGASAASIDPRPESATGTPVNPSRRSIIARGSSALSRKLGSQAMCGGRPPARRPAIQPWCMCLRACISRLCWRDTTAGLMGATCPLPSCCLQVSLGYRCRQRARPNERPGLLPAFLAGEGLHAMQ